MNRYDWYRWWLTWLLGTECRLVGYVVTEAMCPRLAGTLEGRWEYRKLEKD